MATVASSRFLPSKICTEQHSATMAALHKAPVVQAGDQCIVGGGGGGGSGSFCFSPAKQGHTQLLLSCWAAAAGSHTASLHGGGRPQLPADAAYVKKLNSPKFAQVRDVVA